MQDRPKSFTEAFQHLEEIATGLHNGIGFGVQAEARAVAKDIAPHFSQIRTAIRSFTKDDPLLAIGLGALVGASFGYLMGRSKK